MVATHGGGIVACALAEAGRSVIVLEAGPFVAEPDMPTDELAAFDRLYLDHGTTSATDTAVAILAGSCVGGGTVVNWTTCIAPPPGLREEWAREHGLDGFDGAAVDTDVATLESELGVAAANPVGPKDAAILRGGAATGIGDAAVIRRNADCGACGSCGFGCRRGTKASGLRVHLARAHSAGARIVADADVERVLVEGGWAVGVTATVRPGLDRRHESRGDGRRRRVDRSAYRSAGTTGRRRGRRAPDASGPGAIRDQAPDARPEPATPPGPRARRALRRAGGDVARRHAGCPDPRGAAAGR